MLGLLAACSCALSAPPTVTRRSALASVAAASFAHRGAAEAATAGDPRAALLAAITRDVGVEAAIEALVPLDPSAGTGAADIALGGRWKLLWSANAGAFSPLFSRRPFVGSFQLLGDAAVQAGVGSGRVAQLLNLPLGATIELSSGVTAIEGRTPRIFPHSAAALGGSRISLVDASHTDFSAPAAGPRNLPHAIM